MAEASTHRVTFDDILTFQQCLAGNIKAIIQLHNKIIFIG